MWSTFFNRDVNYDKKDLKIMTLIHNKDLENRTPNPRWDFQWKDGPRDYYEWFFKYLAEMAQINSKLTFKQYLMVEKLWYNFFSFCRDNENKYTDFVSSFYIPGIPEEVLKMKYQKSYEVHKIHIVSDWMDMLITGYHTFLDFYPLFFFIITVFLLVLWSLIYNSNFVYNHILSYGIIIRPLIFLILLLFFWYIKFVWYILKGLKALWNGDVMSDLVVRSTERKVPNTDFYDLSFREFDFKYGKNSTQGFSVYRSRSDSYSTLVELHPTTNEELKNDPESLEIFLQNVKAIVDTEIEMRTNLLHPEAIRRAEIRMNDAKDREYWDRYVEEESILDFSPILFSTDTFSFCIHIFILIFTSIILLLSLYYIEINKLIYSKLISVDFYILILFSIIGMFCMTLFLDFMSLYISLEIFTLSLFCLAAFKHTQYSIESSLKYFVIGAWTSCMFLFGVSYFYFSIGSTSFVDFEFFVKITSNKDSINFNYFYSTVAFVFIFSSLIGKLGGAPFHFWLVDVYEGVANPVTAYFSIVSKLPLWVVILKLHYFNFHKISDIYIILIFLFIICSIFVGSIGMYNQSSLKRIFAYSSINHVGLMLIGLLSEIKILGSAAILFHLILYSIILIGIFSIFINLIPFRIFEGNENENIYLNDYKGLYLRNPYLGVFFTFLLFSIAGIPPFSGFFSKFLLLLSILQWASYSFFFIAFIAIIGTVISCYKYIQLIKVILFDELSSTSFFRFDLLSSFILVVSCLISITILLFFQYYYTLILFVISLLGV